MAFLSQLDRQAWLAHSRSNPALLNFAGLVDDLCVTALEQTGRELPAEHAVVMLLRDAAEESERDEVEELLAA